MSKLSLPALASAINELSAEVEELKRRPEPQPMPADLVRISDIPEPPDLLPLAAKIQELQREIAEVAGSVPNVPPDMALKSDIPTPQDLSPIMSRFGRIESEQESIRSSLHDAVTRFSSDIHELTGSVSRITETMDVLRRDLTEARTWVGELGRSWQAHRETVQSAIDSAEDVKAMESRIAAMETVAARTCPDLSPVTLRLNRVESQITEIIGGDE
jgi:hypothetical protein